MIKIKDGEEFELECKIPGTCSGEETEIRSLIYKNQNGAPLPTGHTWNFAEKENKKR